MEHKDMMELLEDKKYLEREVCNDPIFGFLYFVVRGDLMGLCQPNQTGKLRLIVGSILLEDLYEAQPNPFTILHR
jgi:hypothetical protein